MSEKHNILYSRIHDNLHFVRKRRGGGDLRERKLFKTSTCILPRVYRCMCVCILGVEVNIDCGVKELKRERREERDSKAALLAVAQWI